VAARLPAGPAGLIPATAVPGNPQARPGPAARRAVRRLTSDLRSGSVFLAAELSQSGWLDFGAFRWGDISLGQAVRATVGVMAPLIIGVAAGKIEYGSYAALGALPAGFVSFRGISRTRLLAVLAAAAGMAVSTFVGATAAWMSAGSEQTKLGVRPGPESQTCEKAPIVVRRTTCRLIKFCPIESNRLVSKVPRTNHIQGCW